MRDFLKYTFASFVGVLLFVSVGFGGLIVLLILLSLGGQEAVPRVEDRSILTFDLSLEITDSVPQVEPEELLQDALTSQDSIRPIGLRTVLDALEQAAGDDRIVGLYLYGNINPVGPGSGFATMEEVHAALEQFQQSGKPIWAYEVGWSERDYALVSLADTIVLNPSGALEINGFRSEALFFAGALEKYGIGIQAVRAGRYKAAVEPFIRSDRSPEDAEQTRQVLEDLWQDFLSTAATNRDLLPAELQAIANTQGLLLAEEARAAGLIDQVAYFDEILPQLRDLTEQNDEDEPGFRQISLPAYASVVDGEESFVTVGNQIALVYAEGDIVSGSGSPGQIGGDRLSALLRELRQDEDVKAVVLRINSPGGSATASDRITREVQLLQAEKPVIVSMGSLAASGGYQIATYADEIFASPTTITGSIGVFGLLPNFQDIANENGITWDIIETAELADADTVSRPKTEAELAIIQRFVDQLYDQFVNDVAESRNLSRDRVAEIAEGHIWSGEDAQRIGLVDQLGGLEDAIAAAAEQADVGDNWYVREYPEPRTLEEQILNNLFGVRVQSEAAPRDPITLQLAALQADLNTLRALNDPMGLYSRLPFNPRIR